MTYLVDTHCHLSDLSLQGKAGESVEKIIARAYKCGVTHFLCISCTTREFAKMQKCTAAWDNIYLACGIHPLNLQEEPDWTEESLRTCLEQPRILALGETGLDYHYAPESRMQQLDAFARQIALAREVHKPLVVHAREAAADLVVMLKQEQASDCGGVIHCFTDSIETARKCLDLGFYISFTGIATFKSSNNVREVVKYVPDDRIMVETDCPYLAPVPVRGVENEPAFVRYTLNYLAAFKGLSQRHLAELTSSNFERLYGVRLGAPAPCRSECSDWKIEPLWERDFEDR